jgi:DNA-binding response OmpR family regulator
MQQHLGNECTGVTIMTNSNALKGKRILVVEDDFYLASDEASALKEAGAEVVDLTGDSEHARKVIDSEQIDCALVDINLGNGPGFETARALRARKIPFQFTTGYDSATIPAEFSEVVRVEKPFEQKALLTALQRLF